MEDIQHFRDSKTESQMQSLVLRLKVCPVCNSLTRIEADQCSLCNWAGKFETEVDEVAERLGDLLAKCPELLDTLAPSAQPTLLNRLKDFLMQEIRLRKRLDLSA